MRAASFSRNSMGSKRKWEVPSRHTVWEFDEDAPVGAEAEAILSERGAEEIAAELIEAGAIVGGDPDVGVQVEAVEVACAVAARFPTRDPKGPGRRSKRSKDAKPRLLHPGIQAPGHD